MRGFRAFCDDLLQDVPIEAEVGHQPLQLVVLFPKLPQLPQFVQTKTRILLLPQIEALLADSMFTADLDHCRSCFCLPQYPQNLLFRVSSLAHPRLLLVPSRQSRRPRTLNFETDEFSGFGSQNAAIARTESKKSRSGWFVQHAYRKVSRLLKTRPNCWRKPSASSAGPPRAS